MHCLVQFTDKVRWKFLLKLSLHLPNFLLRQFLQIVIVVLGDFLVFALTDKVTTLQLLKQRFVGGLLLLSGRSFHRPLNFHRGWLQLNPEDLRRSQLTSRCELLHALLEQRRLFLTHKALDC